MAKKNNKRRMAISPPPHNYATQFWGRRLSHGSRSIREIITHMCAHRGKERVVQRAVQTSHHADSWNARPPKRLGYYSSNNIYRF